MERKFLSIRQILQKILPQHEHTKMEALERWLWAFQHASDHFPTVIVARICRPTAMSNCNHSVSFYLGRDVIYKNLTGLQVRLLLQRLDFEFPDHFRGQQSGQS
jgi:hypothetical protein